MRWMWARGRRRSISSGGGGCEMDGDTITKLNGQLAQMDMTEDLLTLIPMSRMIDTHIIMLNAQRMSEWGEQGWTANHDGLRCRECGARTYGKVDGHEERIKCTGLTCGAMRTVLVV